MRVGAARVPQNPQSQRLTIEESDFGSTLERTRIDRPTLNYRVDPGVYQDANVWIDASNGGDSADFTAAIARYEKSNVFVDYLLIHGG